MSRTRESPEQIIAKLREAGLRLAQGQSVAQACKAPGVAEQRYDRWRTEYGGMKLDQARRLKELKREPARRYR